MGSEGVRAAEDRERGAGRPAGQRGLRHICANFAAGGVPRGRGAELRGWKKTRAAQPRAALVKTHQTEYERSERRGRGGGVQTARRGGDSLHDCHRRRLSGGKVKGSFRVKGRSRLSATTATEPLPFGPRRSANEGVRHEGLAGAGESFVARQSTDRRCRQPRTAGQPPGQLKRQFGQFHGVIRQGAVACDDAGRLIDHDGRRQFKGPSTPGRPFFLSDLHQANL